MDATFTIPESDAQEVRVQDTSEGTVLEITETVIRKSRFSEDQLLRQKEYFESLIAKGQEGLADVNAKLAQIENGKDA